MDDKAKLLPCPFCGGEGTVDYNPGSWGYTPSTAYVRCKSCTARGALREAITDNVESVKDEAIASWNLRAPAAPERAEPAPQPAEGDGGIVKLSLAQRDLLFSLFRARGMSGDYEWAAFVWAEAQRCVNAGHLTRLQAQREADLGPVTDEERLEQIRQVEEEIAQIDDLMGYKNSDIEREIELLMDSECNEFDLEALTIYVRDQCAYGRILARTQAALDALRQGMKPSAAEEGEK
jgi:Lar family restriction alleviation protein